MATATSRTPSTPTANGHGTKRRANDDLDNAQRLTKRFHLLKLDNRGTSWSKPHQQSQKPQQDRSKPAQAPRCTHVPNETEHMQVDDTKNRVYIHDLDEELANLSDSEDEKRMTFLPDVEKRLNKLPKHVLTGNGREGMSNGQLVVYSIPRTLSVPEDKDSVRKAIIETRARAKEQQPARLSQDAMLHDGASAVDHDMAEDEDAMDLG